MNREIIATGANEDAIEWMREAIVEATKATCTRAKCGAVIVKDGEIIGRGFNSDPKNLESQKRCHIKKNEYHQKVTDKTCCIHAEQRAIMDALKRNGDKIEDSELYFMMLDQDGNPAIAKKPYCTICSKMALDVGVKYFMLLEEEGIAQYETEYYNDLSFNYS